MKGTLAMEPRSGHKTADRVSARQVPFGDGFVAAAAQLQVADARDGPGLVEREFFSCGGQQRLAVAAVSVPHTGDVPWPLVSAAHFDVGAIEEPSARVIQRRGLENLNGQGRFAMS